MPPHLPHRHRDLGQWQGVDHDLLRLVSPSGRGIEGGAFQHEQGIRSQRGGLLEIFHGHGALLQDRRGCVNGELCAQWSRAGTDVAEAFFIEMAFGDLLAVQQQGIAVQAAREMALVDELEAAAAFL